MIAYICLAEACMSYNALIEVINPMYFICYTSSYKILNGFLLGVQDNEEVANMQC